MLVLYLNYEEHANADLILIVGFSVFSALLSTSVTVYLFDVALRKETDTRLTETVSNAVEKSVRNSLNIRSSGLKSVHDSFDRDVFCGSAKSSETMFILQTYAPNLTGIRPAVIELLNRGGHVKLLILDPESEFVKIRASETPNVHKDADAFRSEIEHSCIARFKSFVEASNKTGTAELGLYDRSPGVCIYATDDVMFVSPFLSELDAVSAPQVELAANSAGYSIFLEHFNKVWEDAKLIEV